MKLLSIDLLMTNITPSWDLSCAVTKRPLVQVVEPAYCVLQGNVDIEFSNVYVESDTQKTISELLEDEKEKKGHTFSSHLSVAWYNKPGTNLNYFRRALGFFGIFKRVSSYQHGIQRHSTWPNICYLDSVNTHGKHADKFR